MVWWVAILPLVVVLNIVLALLPIKADFHFQREKEDQLGRLYIRLAGLFAMKVEGERAEHDGSGWKPLINLKVGSKVWKLSQHRKKTLDPTEWTAKYIRQRLKAFDKVMSVGQPFSHYILTRATVSHLSWNTTFGTGDAALTGVLAGVAWSVKSFTVAVLNRKTRGLYTKPHLKVSPVYNATCLITDFHCIFRFRAGHIIGAVASALWQSRQRRG